MKTWLSRQQAHAMTRLNHEWQSASQLEASINALEPLVSRGWVERRIGDIRALNRKAEGVFYRLRNA
jgi:hypothetical protein